ncbi:DUF3301 domain-containing protein [Aliikangiella marina]|uniref:DUF3301 domain-containing protein n=1 Tax=Aliikangiella marina TaxID=1712262 RepID=A0A545TBQ4_9GAMM|nr:DUF3301 domain-containing protein [Aliikangiella marina]TQV74637.1 DUF3301 domain-containing protein [Aliikangiella marina]
MSKVITLIILGVLAYYWWVTQQLKATALRAARQRCQQAGVQLLDHTVVQSKLRLIKDSRNRWRIERRYNFDFTSTGEHRYHGTVSLLGGYVASIELEPFSIN